MTHKPTGAVALENGCTCGGWRVVSAWNRWGQATCAVGLLNGRAGCGPDIVSAGCRGTHDTTGYLDDAGAASALQGFTGCPVEQDDFAVPRDCRVGRRVSCAARSAGFIPSRAVERP